MLDNPVIQNIFSVALYLLRIAVPLLSIVWSAGAFIP